MIPLSLEVYDRDGIQHLPAFRNLRFAKVFEGGEDAWLSFDLDRDIHLDYPDVAYGNDVVLRKGLTSIWKGETRQVEQAEEGITINCLGQWVHLDDKNHGGQGRLWCESRYKRWTETTGNLTGGAVPERYAMDTNNRIFIAPRRNERFGAGVIGSQYYESGCDEIVRVSFDYDCVLPASWELNLDSWASWGALNNNEWNHIGTGSGVKDIILATPRPLIEFWMHYNLGGLTAYTGDTGTTCYVQITNLRLWGQATESPSIIHVAEGIIDEAGAAIDASHDLVQERLFVRDTFTDNNGVLLANHQPDVDKERGGWTMVAGGIDIQANEANATGGGANWAEIDAGVADGVICGDFTTPGAGNFQVGIHFRYTDANNYWRWDIRETGNARLRRVVGGVPTDVYDVNIGIEYGYTYHLMVKLRGADIECYIGGILRTNTSHTHNQTVTRHGIVMHNQAGLRCDNFEVYQAQPIWPMFYEEGESGFDAIKDCASFGDWLYKAIGWGVESGGDRVYVRQADRNAVRYVVPPQLAAQISSRGDAHREFYTSAWARYKDEEGILRWTAKYYVHVTDGGLVVNTSGAGDDLASTVYRVDRDHTPDFGRVDENVAVQYLIQWLMEHGHPQVKSSYQVYGPVQDLHRGGAWIDPTEMETGYVVQIPFFRAVEAEGAVGVDLRDWDTTFFLVGLEHDHERGITMLIPEGATEDLKRIIAYARAFQKKEDREHITKRSEVLGG